MSFKWIKASLNEFILLCWRLGEDQEEFVMLSAHISSSPFTFPLNISTRTNEREELDPKDLKQISRTSVKGSLFLWEVNISPSNNLPSSKGKKRTNEPRFFEIFRATDKLISQTISQRCQSVLEPNFVAKKSSTNGLSYSHSDEESWSNVSFKRKKCPYFSIAAQLALK